MMTRPMPKPLRIIVGCLSAFLLLSLGGGQIMASPLTMPLLWWAARSASTRYGRIALIVVAAFTMTWTAWAAALMTIGERDPYIWLAPLLVGTAVAGLFARTTWPQREVHL